MRSAGLALALLVLPGPWLGMGSSALAQETPAAPTEASAPSEADAVQRDLVVLVRALAYDRNLADRFGSELKVGVLHGGSAPKEEPAAALAVLEALGEVRIGGLALQAQAIPWSNAANLTRAITEGEVDVIFVPRNLDSAAAAVPEVARTLGRTTITRHRPWVEGGLAIGVELHEDKPRLVVNLDAAKAEGASLGADLLRLADVVR